MVNSLRIKELNLYLIQELVNMVHYQNIDHRLVVQQQYNTKDQMLYIEDLLKGNSLIGLHHMSKI